jgi:hypothetical protein
MVGDTEKMTGAAELKNDNAVPAKTVPFNPTETDTTPETPESRGDTHKMLVCETAFAGTITASIKEHVSKANGAEN